MSKAMLDRLAEAVCKQFGKGSALLLGAGRQARSEVADVVPTGIAVIDRVVLGCGGAPHGRMIEIAGSESSGKTSLALALAARACAEGKWVVWVESEEAFSEERARLFGIDLSHLLLLQPDSIEDAFEQADLVLPRLPRGKVLLVHDSVAASPTRAEVKEGLVGKAAMAEKARILSRAVRVLAGQAATRQIAVVLVNQLRANIGVMFGDRETSPGGKAIRFYASAALRLYAGKRVAGADGPKGITVTVCNVKNKLALPFRKAKVRLMFTHGWDDEWATLNYAKDLGLVEDEARGLDGLARALVALEERGWSLDPSVAPVGAVAGGKREADDAAVDDAAADDEEA